MIHCEFLKYIHCESLLPLESFPTHAILRIFSRYGSIRCDIVSTYSMLVEEI